MKKKIKKMVRPEGYRKDGNFIYLEIKIKNDMKRNKKIPTEKEIIFEL